MPEITCRACGQARPYYALEMCKACYRREYGKSRLCKKCKRKTPRFGNELCGDCAARAQGRSPAARPEPGGRAREAPGPCGYMLLTLAPSAEEEQAERERRVEIYARQYEETGQIRYGCKRELACAGAPTWRDVKAEGDHLLEG